MKELSIEEKAKRYNRVIEELRAMMPNWENLSYNGKTFLQDLVHIIPELKDSEDEMIRKTLIHIVKGACNKYGIKYQGKEIGEEKLLAYLEKQGEHANFRNKIQIGDKVTRNEDGVLVNLSQLNRVAKKQGNNMGISEAAKQKLEDNLNKALEKETPESLNKFLDGQGERKPVVIIPKFRVGDEIKTSNEESLTITKIDEKGYWSKDLFICSFDEECIWDLAEPKPQWKPSDEQMDALCYVTNFDYGGYKATLVSLYEQLKKLKG